MIAAGFFGELAPILADLGHECVPIRPGTKASTVSGWPLGHPPGHYLPKHAYWGVGILCRRTPGIDIDVRCRLLVRLLVALIDDVIGGAPVRFGARPKALLPFVCDTPFKKLATRWFALPSEDFRAAGYRAHRLEVLGDGEQFVAYARHPETRHPYRWARGCLLTQERIDLPYLEESDARRLIEAAEAVFLNAGCLPLARRGETWIPCAERPEPDPSGRVDADGLNRADPESLARRIDPKAHRYGAQWRLRCPVHHGRSHTSLALKYERERLLWHCFAGCTQADVGAALREYVT